MNICFNCKSKTNTIRPNESICTSCYELRWDDRPKIEYILGGNNSKNFQKGLNDLFTQVWADLILKKIDLLDQNKNK